MSERLEPKFYVTFYGVGNVIWTTPELPKYRAEGLLDGTVSTYFHGVREVWVNRNNVVRAEMHAARDD